MEIVDVINNQSSENRELWYELVVIENKSANIINLGDKWLFRLREENVQHPSNLKCLIRAANQDADDIIFENIDILPNEKFYIFSGNNAVEKKFGCGCKGMVATKKFIWSDKGGIITLATMDGNVIHTYDYKVDVKNVINSDKSVGNGKLFESKIFY